MTRVRTFRRNAVTRADAIVTTVAIGLLVPLVVAALQDTGEQSRIAQCLSNLGHLMRATHAYFADHADAYPARLSDDGGYGVCSWAYGGKTTADWWRTHYGLFAVPVADRPLNAYVLGGEPQPDAVDGDQIVARTPMPQFRCSSDATSHQRGWQSETVSLIACYDDIGTSYHFNLHAFMRLNVGSWSELSAADWARVTGALVRDGRAGLAATSLWLLEDPLDYAFVDLFDPVQTNGNHGRWSWHAGGYLDGHADYRFVDTRTHCGPGWAVINPSWVRIQGQPSPPIYYASQFVGCDSPD